MSFFGGNTPGSGRLEKLIDLTWREVLEDIGGEILGDDHHLAPGSTQVAILVLVLRRKVLTVL